MSELAPVYDAVGWDALTHRTQGQARKDGIRQLRKTAEIYAVALGSPAGKAMLEDLITCYLARPIVRENDPDKADAIREGMARVVRTMLVYKQLSEHGYDDNDPRLKQLIDAAG